jgi:hypothetical protein
MTLEREYRRGPYVVQCDTCQDVHECDSTNLMSAQAESQREGFVAVARDGGIGHLCAYCFRELVDG